MTRLIKRPNSHNLTYEVRAIPSRDTAELDNARPLYRPLQGGWRERSEAWG